MSEHILSALTKPLSLTFVAICLLIAGGMQTLSLAPYDFWPMSVASVVLILWATKALDSAVKTTHKRAALYGWFFGFGLFGSGASWVYVSIHVYGYASPALAGILTLLFVAFLALFHALSFYLFFRWRTDNTLKNGLLFTALWILCDAFRTYFLTGFPWLFLGYSHLDSPLSGFTPVIGVNGLSLITVLSAVGLYLIISSPKETSSRILGGSVVLLWLLGIGLQSVNWTQAKPEAPLTVALMQTNIPQELKWHPAQRRKTIALLEELSTSHWQHDILVWPETAIPMLYDRARGFLNHMGKQAEENNTAIITGIPFRQFNDDGSQTIHNSITSIGMGDGIYHKQKLVPFGEYVPLQEILRGLIAFFDLPMSDFRRGPEDQALLEADGNFVSPFICYEVVYPDFVNGRAENADLLLTISNDSWFGKSIGPLQHLQMAQMRAAEQGRYMIRGTNNGISAIIDEKGNITAQSQQFVQTVLESEVQIFEGRTPFSYFGSYPIFMLSALTVLFIAFPRRKAL